MSVAIAGLSPQAMDILRPLACERLCEDGAAPGEAAPRAVALAANASPEARAAAVEAAYKKHHRLVYRVALRYGKGSASWAEDVTQDVFLDLHKALPALTDLDDLAGWLYRATTNRCMNRLRRERFLALAPVRWLLGERQAEPPVPESVAIARADLRRAFDALDALPVNERVAFSMYYLDDREQEEIGRVLGHSKSYVCKLIQRAAERLRAAGWEVARG
jgi:RNA polymerase sigma-70 factor (ECF subfamily)